MSNAICYQEDPQPGVRSFLKVNRKVIKTLTKINSNYKIKQFNLSKYRILFELN